MILKKTLWKKIPLSHFNVSSELTLLLNNYIKYWYKLGFIFQYVSLPKKINQNVYQINQSIKKFYCYCFRLLVMYEANERVN